MAANTPEPGEFTVTVRYTTEEVPGRGWIAHSPDMHVTAQGETEDEALNNMVALVTKFPDLLDPLFAEVRREPARHMELVPA